MFVPLVGDGHIPILFSYIQGTCSGLGCSSLMSSMFFFTRNWMFILGFPYPNVRHSEYVYVKILTEVTTANVSTCRDTTSNTVSIIFFKDHFAES